MKPALLEGQDRPGLLLTDKGLLLHHLRLHILIISSNIIQLFLYNPTVPLLYIESTRLKTVSRWWSPRASPAAS